MAKAADPLTDVGGEFVGRASGVEHEEPRRLSRGDREEAARTRVWKSSLLGLEPVEGLVVRIEPTASDRRIEIEQHGEVGKQTASRPQRQSRTSSGPRPPGTLVGDRRVEVTILNHDLPPCERRTHHRLDVMGAIGGVQQSLGRGVDVARWCSTISRISTPTSVPPGSRVRTTADRRRGQPLLEQRGLRGLARTVPALERDEQTREVVGSRRPPSLLRRRLASRRGPLGWGPLLRAGPLARLSAMSCRPLEVTVLTSSPRGIVAFVYAIGDIRAEPPVLDLIALPLTGSASNSLSALDAPRAPYFGCA